MARKRSLVGGMGESRIANGGVRGVQGVQGVQGEEPGARTQESGGVRSDRHLLELLGLLELLELLSLPRSSPESGLEQDCQQNDHSFHDVLMVTRNVLQVHEIANNSEKARQRSTGRRSRPKTPR